MNLSRGPTFYWLAAAVLLSACGESADWDFRQNQLPIINGQIDQKPNHEAVVALAFGGFMCSGTLISGEVVLTAAHCADGIPAGAYTVHFGVNLSGGTTRSVSEVKVHPSWDSVNLVNDIALLRLASPAPPTVKPIPYLPRSLGISDADVGKPLEFVGFGRTEVGGVGVKLTVTKPLDWICTQSSGCMVSEGYVFSPKTIAVDQTRGGGACNGDSGGPAFVVRNGQEYVAGITSYGDQYCEYFGCSTKVDEFESFIADFVGGVLGSPCASATVCLSGFCESGVCCETTCSGVCMACNVPGGMGKCSPALNGAPCSDGNPCNGEEVCLMQECVAGQSLDCDDNNPCTMDTCNSKLGCVHEPVAEGTPCPNDNPCDGEEACRAGACQPGVAPDCDDRNPCTKDGCAPTIGCAHENLVDGTQCGGGLCGAARCSDGFCAAEDPVTCDDGESCTKDWCDPQMGCVHEPAADGDKCGVCRVCAEARCVPGGDCVIQGGCGCSLESGTAADELTGFLLLLLAFVSLRPAGLRRRRGHHKGGKACANGGAPGRRVWWPG